MILSLPVTVFEIVFLVFQVFSEVLGCSWCIVGSLPQLPCARRYATAPGYDHPILYLPTVQDDLFLVPRPGGRVHLCWRCLQRFWLLIAQFFVLLLLGSGVDF